ncbi:hypothetical protein BTVI_128875 [Pitangus sulphuratus]|nr:hypothetical protein BTVI_128875 [Pitangus sulphuratus]
MVSHPLLLPLEDKVFKMAGQVEKFSTTTTTAGKLETERPGGHDDTKCPCGVSLTTSLQSSASSSRLNSTTVPATNRDQPVTLQWTLLLTDNKMQVIYTNTQKIAFSLFMANWTEAISQKKPILDYSLYNNRYQEVVQVRGMIDTGIDVTIIARKDWMDEWELIEMFIPIQGVGHFKIPLQSFCPITIKGPYKREARCIPFVMDLPLTLGGQDVLVQWNIELATNSNFY